VIDAFDAFYDDDDKEAFSNGRQQQCQHDAAKSSLPLRAISSTMAALNLWFKRLQSCEQ
jgi:hypothetical protein